jgi:gluconokinase
MIILVMGAAGAGKTTVGSRLAWALSWEFVDADRFHSEANHAKMARGEPLDEADRAPWLDALAEQIRTWLSEGRNVVLAASALRAAHRDRLLLDPQRTRVVYLAATPELLAERLASRTGHFFAPSLLDSQLATLEPPADALTVDASATPDAIVEEIRRRLGV